MHHQVRYTDLQFTPFIHDIYSTLAANLAPMSAVLLLGAFFNTLGRVRAHNNLLCFRLSETPARLKYLYIFLFAYVRFCILLTVAVLATYWITLPEEIIVLLMLLAVSTLFWLRHHACIHSFDLSNCVYGGKYLPQVVKQALTFSIVSLPIIAFLCCVNALIQQDIFLLLSTLLFTVVTTAPVLVQSILL